MVITVNLNPNIDRLVKVDGFVYGGTNRVAAKKDDVTSKGINAAVVMKRLGVDVLCTGFMYEQDGELAIATLKKDGIPHDYVWQPGSLRINMKILDTKTSVVTEVNDRGTPAEEKYISALTEKVFSLAGKDDIIAMTGSIPPGCPAGLFAGLIEAANQRGIRCALDAEGEILKKGVEAHPFFVKINRFELETLVGKPVESDEAVVSECENVIKNGISLVSVSLGAGGAIITDGKSAYKADGLQITPKSTTGAGDSMLAGMLAAILKKQPLPEVLRMGTAAATASVLCEGTELMTPELYESVIEKVVIHKLR